MRQKEHWEKIYKKKKATEVSWYQAMPQVPLDFINDLGIPKNAAIIDIGGGNSYLADNLLKLGFTDITVLDISTAAINQAKERLGKAADNITWIVSDIADFSSKKLFDFWHDRAAFHFLISESETKQYLAVLNKQLSEKGTVLIGTFSTNGPRSCSGLPVNQYSEKSLSELLRKGFEKIKCVTVNHHTPLNTVQNFLFCSFKKIKSA